MSWCKSQWPRGRDGRKRKRALEVIESDQFGTPAQVLQEFFVTVVTKAARPPSAAEALKWIEQFSAFPCRSIIDSCGSRLRSPHDIDFLLGRSHSRVCGGARCWDGLLRGFASRTAIRTGPRSEPVLLEQHPPEKCIGYITAKDMPAGRQQEVHVERTGSWRRGESNERFAGRMLRDTL
jgi:hypothetical protein